MRSDGGVDVVDDFIFDDSSEGDPGEKEDETEDDDAESSERSLS